MAGGYDEATLRRLGERLSAPRLLQMLTQLQTAGADLARSSNRRTDAELCIIRLSDEGLDESFAGLSARIARLEERLVQGVTAAVPESGRNPVRPGRLDGASRVEDAVKKQPAEVVGPHKEGDSPPWEEERPPLPDEPPEEPERVFDEPKPERPKPAEQGGGDSAFWPSFAAGLRGKVPPTVMPYLNNPAKVTGTWKNGQLTLWVDSEFTRSMLNKPAVLEKLAQAAAASFGGQPQVSVITGAPPPAEAAASKAAEKDPLDDLLSFGGQFDNITIQ